MLYCFVFFLKLRLPPISTRPYTLLPYPTGFRSGVDAAITITPAEAVAHVLAAGEITAIGAYRLKRSLVAGQQRLELLDWPAARLPQLKAAGCFTEIIQHKTRLFVPPVRAVDHPLRIPGCPWPFPCLTP